MASQKKYKEDGKANITDIARDVHILKGVNKDVLTKAHYDWETGLRKEGIAESVDNAVFNNMQKATESKASKLFTESQYNTFASKKERAGYDKKALNALIGMWQSDRDKNEFKGIDFNRYVELLRPSLFEERVLAREGDQKLGDFFLDIYEGDVDQFKASAMRAPREEAVSD